MVVFPYRYDQEYQANTAYNEKRFDSANGFRRFGPVARKQKQRGSQRGSQEETDVEEQIWETPGQKTQTMQTLQPSASTVHSLCHASMQ